MRKLSLSVFIVRMKGGYVAVYAASALTLLTCEQ